jgi:asparagine synthase (glutamine-hydrolysing)
MLDGVFAFVLHDKNNDVIYVARDPLGVRPLYLYNHFSRNPSLSQFGFASELKCLEHFYNDNDVYSIYKSRKILRHFKPGAYSVYKLNKEDPEEPYWDLDKQHVPYFFLGHPHFKQPQEMMQICQSIAYYLQICQSIAYYLNCAVNKRCLTTERPIACLLSGGLDSSLIAALVNNYYIKNKMPNKLETYSIGLEGSEDLKYARIVAKLL